MKFFGLGVHAKKTRNSDIWFETGKAPMSGEVLKSVKVMSEIFQQAVVFHVPEGIYCELPGASGTKNKTGICYARFDANIGLYFTALDASLISDFIRSLVHFPGSEVGYLDAVTHVETQMHAVVPDLNAAQYGYLFNVFATVLKDKNADESLVRLLLEIANGLNASESLDAAKKYLTQMQTQLKTNDYLKNFFANPTNTLPWSLGVRIETNLKPLFDFYQTLIADRNQADVQGLNQQLLTALGQKLELKKIINGVAQAKSEFFGGEPGKTPFDMKDVDGKPVLRLSLMKITEKFAGGYVQIATDLLGFDENVAMAASMSVREQHLAILQSILNQWEQAVALSLKNLSGDVAQSIPLLIAAFSASQNKQDIVACALKTCPDFCFLMTGNTARVTFNSPKTLTS